MLGRTATKPLISESVLVIIDAQNEYAVGKLTVKGVAESRKVIASLLQQYRDAGVSNQIVHVVHDTPEGAPVFTPNTELAKEFDELTPRAGEKIIHKQHPSAFAGTDLQEFIDGLGKKVVVLTGYMAHVCVSTTSRQGDQLGYDIVVVRDAIGDRDIPGIKGEQLTEVVLHELADTFATVVNSNEVV